jgi:hypothetical protein
MRSPNDRDEIAEALADLLEKLRLASPEVVSLFALAAFGCDGVIDRHRVRGGVGVEDAADGDGGVEGAAFHRDLRQVLDEPQQVILSVSKDSFLLRALPLFHSK